MNTVAYFLALNLIVPTYCLLGREMILRPNDFANLFVFVGLRVVSSVADLDYGISEWNVDISHVLEFLNMIWLVR